MARCVAAARKPEQVLDGGASCARICKAKLGRNGLYDRAGLMIGQRAAVPVLELVPEFLATVGVQRAEFLVSYHP